MREAANVIQSLESVFVLLAGLDPGVKESVKRATMAPIASIGVTAGTMHHVTKELVAANALPDGMDSCVTKVGTSFHS